MSACKHCGGTGVEWITNAQGEAEKEMCTCTWETWGKGDGDG